MAYWWVNHKQTRDQEVQGGYLWSPMRNANNGFNQSYENMRLVSPGDLVFSYADGRIAAIGHVIDRAAPSPKPTEFGKIGDYWSNEGWLVNLYFSPTPKTIKPSDIADKLAPLLPVKYSPIRQNGHGNQGIYLASIPDSLGELLLSLLGVSSQPEFPIMPMLLNQPFPDATVLEDVHNIESDGTIPPTQRLQLTKARVGQGLFRTRVMLVDPTCRVTGVSDSRLLIASHIKPWKDSSSQERLSGFNGIMLSPHLDTLFDEHLITFENDGQMRTHPSVSEEVMNRWNLNPTLKVAPFAGEQFQFLEHHRSAFAGA